MDKVIIPKKITILKPQATLEEIQDIVEKKKTTLYGSLFKRPKQEQIQISSIDLFYEPYWIVGGKYNGEYFRKNTYEVETEDIVKEVLIGNGVFPVRTESGTWKKLRTSMKVGEKGNKLDIPVEEHVEIHDEDEIVFNSQGNEVKFNYKIDSKNIENFPDDFIENNKNNIRPTSLTETQVVDKLLEILNADIDDVTKVVKEKIEIDKLELVYVPVYEARCVDNKNKIEILRIDGLNLKIL